MRLERRRWALALEALADEAIARFGLMGILIVHRVGEMRPGEPIVLVSACARHRRGAIDAVDLLDEDADIDIDPRNPNVWYVASASGGTRSCVSSTMSRVARAPTT